MKFKNRKSILKVSAIILLAMDLLFYLLALKNLYVFSSSVSSKGKPIKIGLPLPIE